MPLTKSQMRSRSGTLCDTLRIQAAEVGIRLVPRSHLGTMASAKEHAAELDFLTRLRGKTALLHLVPYENWMSSRSHERLLFGPVPHQLRGAASCGSRRIGQTSC